MGILTYILILSCHHSSMIYYMWIAGEWSIFVASNAFVLWLISRLSIIMNLFADVLLSLLPLDRLIVCLIFGIKWLRRNVQLGNVSCLLHDFLSITMLFVISKLFNVLIDYSTLSNSNCCVLPILRRLF